MRLVVQHHRTPIRRLWWQYFRGRNHHVRRLLVNAAGHHILVMLIPRGVRVRTSETGVWREV